MDDKKKKKYIIPEAEVVDFADDDIITYSDGTQRAAWDDDNNGERWGE